MMRTAAVSLLIVAALLTACGSPPPSSGTRSPSVTEPPAQVWELQTVDSAPGPIVTDMIGGALGVPADDVIAAVFVLSHPAGNGAAIWVFRAGGLSSQEALDRWEASEPKCEGSAQPGSLAGLETVVIRRRFIDQCQPQYLVMLDGETLAVITDDGAYAGNAATTPTVPYRPASDIAFLVRWLQTELKTVDLQPGGPPQTNNG